MTSFKTQDKNNIDIIENANARCRECNGKATLRTFILKDAKPHKVIGVSSCSKCGVSATDFGDNESLKYGIKITCDFTKCTPEQMEKNIRRMTLINSQAIVKISLESGPLTEYSSATCEIDSVQGILMQAYETISSVLDSDSGDVMIINGKLKKLVEGSPFKMVVEDDSGYSRVCPFGSEYTDMQDEEPEKFNDEFVTHEKVKKKAIN